MNKKTEIEMKNSETNDISSLLEIALKKYGYSSDLVIRYSFIFEEVLLRWKEVYDSDQAVSFNRIDYKNYFKIEISIFGEKLNPLQENVSEDILESLISRLKSKVGPELKYSYKNGFNTVSLYLPKKNIEQKLFNRSMILLSIPVILQLFVLSLAGIVDSIMLSYYNQTSLAAASLISQFTTLFNAFISPLGIGMTVLLVKYWDNRDFDRVHKLIATGIRLQALIGIIFFFVAEFIPDTLMSMYTNIPTVHAQGVLYLKAIAPYYLFTAIAEVYICFMRNTKAVIRSSAFVIIAQIVNCLINGVLIFGMFGFDEMGITGAGISTSISGVLLFVLAIIEYNRSKLLNLKLGQLLKHDPEIEKEYLKISAPLLFQFISYNAAANVINALIGRTDVDAISAVAIRTSIFTVLQSVNSGTGTISTVLMTPYLNADNKEKALVRSRYLLSYIVRIGLFTSFLFASSYFVLPYIYGNITPKTMDYLKILIIVSAISMFFACHNNCLNAGVLLPSGDVKAIIIIDIIVVWGAVVLTMYLGMRIFLWPSYILIMFVALDEIISSPFKHMRFRSKKWLENLNYKEVK